MKKTISLCNLLVMILMTSGLFAQSQEEMKAYMEYMAPGPSQQMMAKSVGAWTAESTMWTKEGIPPTKSTFETTNEMILGGRYLQGTHKGTMWGQPYEGIGTTGYDNARKVYVSTWIDNMGTGIMYLEGTWDAATKSIRLAGKETDPVSKKEMPIREVLTFTDDTHQVLEMYFTENGKEVKAMEIKFTKK